MKLDSNTIVGGTGATQGRARPTTLFVGVLLIGALIAGLVGGCQPSETQTVPETVSETPDLDPEEAFRAFAQCMRDHGIANYPDPTGSGINIRGLDIDPNSPEFKAAQEACFPLLPHPPRQPAAPGGPRSEGGEVRRTEKAGVTAWQKILPAGDCECADGSEFAFFDHKGDPTKVLFYLDGGGACFDAASCANANTPGSGERPGPDYDPNIHGEDPSREGGMLDLAREDNPFHEFSAIYVPLCTADAHLGSAIHEYAPGLVVKHKGLVNGKAGLSYLAEHYPGVAQVVVVGHTTIAAPLYGGLVADRFPSAKVTVIGSQAGAVPDIPDLNATIGDAWGVFDSMPDWDVNEGLTAREWGGRQFWIRAGLHKPDMVLARFDYAFDPNAAETLEYLAAMSNTDIPNTLASIDANEQAIEAAGVTLHSYTAPGQHHGILEFGKFYEMEVNGVKLVDWVQALIDGDPLDDVRCEPCEE